MSMRIQVFSAILILFSCYFHILSQKYSKKLITTGRILYKDRIVFAVDSRYEIFTNIQLRFANDLFDIHVMRPSLSFPNETDLIMHTDWNNVMMMYKKSPTVNTSTLLPNIKKDIEIFSNKVQWHEMMNSIGLVDMVPHTYSVSGNLRSLNYPLVLRTNRNFGRGSFIIENKSELSLKISELLAKDKSFMLEESLTGLGQSVISTFGGAYKGRLLSMRCVIRSFATASAASTAGNTTSGGAGDRPYVRGFHLKHSHEHWLPCGRDLIEVHKKMFAATTYSGSWCSEVKLDSKMQPKILEVNARFCGSLAGNDALFLLSFVPIAFAMLEADPSARIAHALRGAHNGTYRHILAQEQNALETGGGFYLRQWVTVDKFNPFLKLDPVDQYLTRQTIRAYSKIVVAVKDPGLLFRFTQLKASSSLFLFCNGSAPVMPAVSSLSCNSVDLVLPPETKATITLPASDEPGTIKSVLLDRNAWVSTLQRLGYNAYVPKQYRSDDLNISNFPVTLRTWLTAEHNSSTYYPNFMSGNRYTTMPATSTVVVTSNTVLTGLIQAVSSAAGVSYALEEVLPQAENTKIKVFGSAHCGTLLSMRCILYTPYTYATIATAAPKKQLVACGRDLVSVLTGYFAESGSFAGAFCATVEMNASGQPKFTELQMGLCEELTLSDAGFIGAYVPLAAALFIDRNRDRGGSRSSTPIELNWLENRKIFRHIIAVERHVLAGGGGQGPADHPQRVDKFHPPGIFIPHIGYHSLDGFPATSLAY